MVFCFSPNTQIENQSMISPIGLSFNSLKARRILSHTKPNTTVLKFKISLNPISPAYEELCFS